MSRGIAVVSGGMDSVAMLYKLVRGYGDLPDVVSFDYGQKHWKEIEYAQQICLLLRLRHDIIDFRDLGRQLSSSLTTDGIHVPDGHYAEESMKATVVPNRNMIMASVAAGIAISRDMQFIAFGVHAGDHFIYPDCRPAFFSSLRSTLMTANQGFIDNDFRVFTPWINMSKADIVTEGQRYGVPWHMTWSCYKGGALHCGKCGTCTERIEAFQLAGVEDPTIYEKSA